MNRLLVIAALLVACRQDAPPEPKRAPPAGTVPRELRLDAEKPVAQRVSDAGSLGWDPNDAGATEDLDTL